MKKTLFALACAFSMAFSGSALADIFNFASTPSGTAAFTATSVTFTGLASAGPNGGVFSGFGGCTSCITMTSFTQGTATPFVVFTGTQAGPETISVTLNNDVFSLNADGTLGIKGSGTASINGGPAQQILFSFSTQQAGGATAGVSYSGTLTAVPLPGALLLFGSGMVGLVALGKRRKKQLAIAA